MNRVAVTGLGIVCSLGRGAPAVWEALIAGRRGFSPVTAFDPGGASSAPVACVTGTKGDLFPRAASRLDQLFACASDEAVAGAGLKGSSRLTEFAVAAGNSNGGIFEAERWFDSQAAARRGDARVRRGLSARPALLQPASVSTDALAARLGASGPRLTNTTACSSSAGAIAAAADWIREGEVESAIAGGGDTLCRLTYAGFASLRLMDPQGCRPFDENRKGLTLGEGAAFLVLENRESASRRGARLLAEILEHGASCDAHHMTACHPEGRGMGSAMSEALSRSRVPPASVGYINAHGTATRVNDAGEGKAIAHLFAPLTGPAVSSTKSMHGHLLGGSGAIEAVITVLALLHGLLPANAGLDRPEPRTLDLVRGGPRRTSLSYALSNSFGFGGGNVSLLFAAAGKEE